MGSEHLKDHSGSYFKMEVTRKYLGLNGMNPLPRTSRGRERECWRKVLEKVSEKIIQGVD